MLFKGSAKEILESSTKEYNKKTFPRIPTSDVVKVMLTIILPPSVELFTTKKGSNVKVNSISINAPVHIPVVGDIWRWNISYVAKVKCIEQYILKDTHHIVALLGKPKKSFRKI